MKVRKQFILSEEVMRALLGHFEYNIKDVKSYDELTTAEKEIIPKAVFDALCEP